MARTVLVTGASKGIGRAIALGMAGRGYDVAVNDLQREAPELEALAGEIRAAGSRAIVLPGDISPKADASAMVEGVIGEWGVLDVLVNNAGVLSVGLVEDLTEEAWDTVFDVYAKGTFLVTQAAIPHMKRRRTGRIVNIASIGGKQGHRVRATIAPPRRPS